MRRLIHVAAASFVAASCFALALTPAVRADGLFYTLPEDGTSATYDLKAETKGQENAGTLTLRSVGKIEHNGEPARWLEVSITLNEAGRDQTIIGKLLVKEKYLQRGEHAFDNFEKLYMGDGEQVEQITDVRDEQAGLMAMLFSGPLADVKKIEAETIETGVGKLKCRGEAGTLQLKQGTDDISFEFENRFHEMAPFGVARSVVKYKVKRPNNEDRQGVFTLTLNSTSKGVKSALPDSN
jgi:hypothetical protein